jgi:hypothetical protein
MRRMLLWAAAVAAASLVAVPVSASAAGWNCSAAALAGQPSGTPVAANVGATTCRAANPGSNLPAALPAPLQATTLSARTTLDGPAGEPAQQRASATGEVSSFGVGVPADVPIALPSTSVPVPLVGNVDITSALRTLVPVASGLLVGVEASSATAAGECSGDAPRLTGSTHVTGLTVLGQALPADQAVTQTVNVVNAVTIDPSLLSAANLPRRRSDRRRSHAATSTAASRWLRPSSRARRGSWR